MGSGAYSTALAGNCFAVPVRHCSPFKEFCVHTLGSSPTLGSGVDSGLFGCNAYGSVAGTQLLPQPGIPGALSNHPVYGKTSGTVTLPNYFNTSDLAPWRSRQIVGAGDPYNNRASGPAVKQAHMVTEVRRRLKRTTSPHNNDYVNRYGFYFTDASTAYFGDSDWMGFLHPSGCFWTNKGVPEPFSAVNFYEDSGAAVTTADVYNQNFIPFCSPMNTYSSGGTLLGQYIGYTAMYYFGAAYIKRPIAGSKPPDYYSSTVPPPEVTPTYQFFSIDCHLFLVASPASGMTLKSPKIGSIRHWAYNKDFTTWDLCDQYMYMLHGGITGSWKFNVVFNLPASSETILFNLSNFQTYVTP